jgi:hypothetical protein
MPVFTQINATTWHADYSMYSFTIRKYFDGGYTIDTLEGIFVSFDDITQYITQHY